MLWGFGGAFISIALSRVMAKRMMGVKIIDPQVADPDLQNLVRKVYEFSRRAGIQTMPQVGYYEADDLLTRAIHSTYFC